MVTRRIRYRIWQFFSMVRSSFQPVDIEYVKAKLPSPSLLALFTRMPRMEQNHGVSVCKALEQQGEYPPELLTAALLHDVGKIKHFPRLYERVFVVLIYYFAPSLATKLAQGPAKGFRRGFVIRSRHAGWGADLVRHAGASVRIVNIVSTHHSEPDDDEELTALQAVDDG